MLGMKNTMGLMLLMVVGLTQAAPQISTSEVVNTVTSQLQPLISKAVADALASTSSFQPRRPSFSPSIRPVAEEPTAPAAYQYSYKVSDEEAQTYLNKDETRDGDNVQGTYSYVDSTGALVTVTYTAGPQGYNEEREVQKGFVTMRNIPGAWTGPLAGVDDVAVVPARVQPAPRPAPRKPEVDQAQLIQLIISQLQPSISSAVQSAISSRSTVAAAPRLSENSVSFSTPEFTIEY